MKLNFTQKSTHNFQVGNEYRFQKVNKKFFNYHFFNFHDIKFYMF
jgi:hypothetical protein